VYDSSCLCNINVAQADYPQLTPDEVLAAMKLAEELSTGRVPVEMNVDKSSHIDTDEIIRRRDEMQHLLSSGLLVPERDNDAITDGKNVIDDSEREARVAGLGQNCHEDRRDNIIITR
jgi:hypothetical protein